MVWLDFSREALNQIFSLQNAGFRNFVLQNCFVNFDAEQVYLKLHVTNFKAKKVVTKLSKPQLQTLEKISIFFFSKTLNSKFQPYTQNPKP